MVGKLDVKGRKQNNKEKLYICFCFAGSLSTNILGENRLEETYGDRQEKQTGRGK